MDTTIYCPGKRILLKIISICWCHNFFFQIMLFCFCYNTDNKAHAVAALLYVFHTPTLNPVPCTNRTYRTTSAPKQTV